MIHLFKKQTMPEQSFLNSVAAANSMKALVAKTVCPSCNQLTLGAVRVEQGAVGFETQVACSNCHFSGLSNSTGFQFSNVNSKGKAVT